MKRAIFFITAALVAGCLGPGYKFVEHQDYQTLAQCIRQKTGAELALDKVSGMATITKYQDAVLLYKVELNPSYGGSALKVEHHDEQAAPEIDAAITQCQAGEGSDPGESPPPG